MRDDPFKQYRQASPHYTATTAPDGLSLTLVAVDVAAFHATAHDAIAVANRCGWLTEIQHHLPGANIARLTVTPRR